MSEFYYRFRLVSRRRGYYSSEDSLVLSLVGSRVHTSLANNYIPCLPILLFDRSTFLKPLSLGII